MQFARWVFRSAGILGLLMLLPMYFLEEQISRDQPPPIAHPEFFYGFIGVAVAWQAAFLVISLDPERYRLLMLPAVIEKFSFFSAAAALFIGGRLALPMLAAGLLDAAWGVLFVVSFWVCRPRSS